MTSENDLLQQLFTHARSQNGWREGAVVDDQLRAAYDLAKWGPTSMNAQPMRLVILRSNSAKEQIQPLGVPLKFPRPMVSLTPAVWRSSMAPWQGQAISMDVNWYPERRLH